MAETQIIQLNASTHLPIKLTQTNFIVRRRQLFSTLIGSDLLGYVDGKVNPPPEFLDDKQEKPNPTYSKLYCQDQIIISAMLGSCSEKIQPHISSVSTAREAWDQPVALYANKSRTRILSLKDRLMIIPIEDKSVSEYLQEMRVIADESCTSEHPR